jgi:hypothetical protein
MLMDAMKKGATRVAVGKGPAFSSRIIEPTDQGIRAGAGTVPADAPKIWFETDAGAYPAMTLPPMLYEPVVQRLLEIAEIAGGPRIAPTRERIHVERSAGNFFMTMAAFPEGSDPLVVIILHGERPPESIPRLEAFRFTYPSSA